jgi:hypothetical protein
MRNYHGSELLDIYDCAVSLGTGIEQIKRWAKEGSFPPPVEIEGKPLCKSPVFPRDEVGYIAALMTAGKPWKHIQDEVRRMKNCRSRRLSYYEPDHAKGVKLYDVEVSE